MASVSQGAMSNELMVCQAPSQKSLVGCVSYRLHLVSVGASNLGASSTRNLFSIQACNPPGCLLRTVS